MDDTTSSRSVWSLHGTIGNLDCGELSGELDVARPYRGLHQSAFDHERVPLLIFRTRRSPAVRSAGGAAKDRNSDSFQWPLPVADAYVRVNDLVATYHPTNDWPYLPQLYWQAQTLQSVEGVLASLSQLVSVQTHLLDTYPKINISSQVPSNESLCITIGEDGHANIEPANLVTTIAPTGSTFCVLWRMSAAQVSYVEIASSPDVRHIAFLPGTKGELIAEWHVFADFLEKGVIRRARVHGALLPRKNDVELALECCRAIEQCPLPLTT